MDNNINDISAITYVRSFFQDADEESILARLSIFERRDSPNDFINNPNSFLSLGNEETIEQYHSRFLFFLDNRPQT